MKVYLLGAGPGDPGLLTLKARDALAAADVVVYDALANDSLLGHARPDAELIYVGKVAGNHALPQHEINALLVRKAKEGNMVARLKGGDPYIFGRGGEEAEELLAAGVPFEEVPGISSTIAAPAYAGIPLTHRDFASSVTIITGHENPDKPGSVHNWQAGPANPGGPDLPGHHAAPAQLGRHPARAAPSRRGRAFHQSLGDRGGQGGKPARQVELV